MSAKGKSALSQIFDLPLVIAAALTCLFYWYVKQPSMHGSLLHQYTTEHTVEYVVVAFFIWGLTDVFYRALLLPREMLALRQEWLPRRTSREPVARAAALLAHLKTRPRWMLDSRLGKRLTTALAYLQDKGSADDFGDFLRHLGDQDLETTHSNFALTRFMCGITPMFGFLGTVVHFGTALGGQSSGDIADKLPKVVAEMGTAFNTTTVALVAATTLMFALFVCERAERSVVLAIDRRSDDELQNRFEVIDATMAPYLSALQLANKTMLQAYEATIDRQMTAWAGALENLQRQYEQLQQRQSQVWVEALEQLEGRFEVNDQNREKRMARLLEKMDSQDKEHHGLIAPTIEQVGVLRTDFARLVEQLAAIAKDENHLVGSQALLADNLRVLRESQQIDQALHGLTAAIHMLTARSAHSGGKEARAA